MTMVGIECNGAAFNVISRRSTPEIVLSRETIVFILQILQVRWQIGLGEHSQVCSIDIIGERSEPSSDKLGGESFISSCHLYVCHYIYMVYVQLDNNTMPTHIVCAHSHLFLTYCAEET